MSDFRRRRFVTLVLLAIAAAAAPAAAQDWRTISQSRQANGERSMNVDVTYAAGEFRLGAAQPGTLYRASMRYDAEVFEPRMDFSGRRLRVGMQGDVNIKGRTVKGGSLDLRIGPDVPISLDLEFGATEAEIDLGGLAITNAEITTGASQTKLSVSRPNRAVCEELQLEVGAAQFHATGLGNLNAERIELTGGVGEITLDFSGEWRRNMSGKIDLGLGELTLKVPRSVALSVKRGGLLASFDSQGMTKRGERYYSENWDSARHRITLEINAAFGSINVVWIDG